MYKMAEVYTISCTTNTLYFASLTRYATYLVNAMPRGHDVLCHVAH